jgi:3-phenylpropionate/trans-cinnamate dioxygenase ferredoxin component
VGHWVKAGSVYDFEPGALRAVSVGGEDVAVVQVDGRFYAFSNFCTHEAVTFTAGYGFVRDGAVACMMHSSWFDLETGEVLAGPAADDLTVYPVRVEDGQVFVESR